MSLRNPIRLGVTTLEGRDVPSTTNLFDARFYLAHNPDVAAYVSTGAMTAEQHFRIHGDKEHRSGNPIFDDAQYLADYPDVRAAVQQGIITPFRHFELHGQFESRNPSHSFNVRNYLDDNPDVKAFVATGAESTMEHFWRHGQFEDRLPFHGFDRTAYLDDNPDVRDAVEHGVMTAVQHYENFGRFENRQLRTSTPITLTAGQTTTITGISQNHDDRKFYSFTAPQAGTLRVVVESSNGVFAKAEVENARTSVDILETDPNDGINSASGSVLGGGQYILRLRAPANAAAQFTVRLTLS
jgi:hypothetical protein